MMNTDNKCITSEEENNMTFYDIIIVGAGPAGCASAITLAQHGLNVGLVDEINPHKPKVGESIPSAIKRLLTQLGINNINTILNDDEYKPCVTNASAWGSEHWQYQDAILNPEGNGWHIDRNAFDAALYQYTIRNGVIPIKNQVKNVIDNDNYYTINLKNNTNENKTVLNTKWIIDATGRSSKVGRSLGFHKEKLSEQMAVIAWIKTDKDKDFATRIKSVQNGWWYTALLPNQRRIAAFHGLVEDVQQLVHNSDRFTNLFNSANLIKSTINNTQIINRVEGRNANFGKLNVIANHRFLAVGDAAISFDPLAAQGIFFALYSGIKAGEVIAKSCENPNHQNKIIESYLNQIESVFQYNRKTLKLHYNNEVRYLDEPYWQKMNS
ncbi:MAG: NAD(P)/FAD-dependent oxidoreductase [Saprospiraceae bacterium]